MGPNFLILAVAAIVVLALVVLIALRLARRSKISRRVLATVDPVEKVRKPAQDVAALKYVEAKLSTTTFFVSLSQQLSILGSTTSAAQYVLVTVIIAGVLSLVGLVTLGPLGFIFLLVAVVGVRIYIPIVQLRRRRAKFEEQFDYTLSLFSASVRAGHSLVRAVEIVAAQTEAPTAPEFARALNSIRLGRDLGDSLMEISERMQSEELEWVVQSINIHRESGGNLTEMFEKVVATIKDRSSIRVMIRTLSTDGRVSGQVMCVLPFAIVLFFGVQNPANFAVLINTPVGNVMLAVAVVLYITGVIWIQKIVTVKF